MSLSSLNHMLEKLNTKPSMSSAIEYFLETQKKPYLYFKWIENQCALKLIHSQPAVAPVKIRLYESDSSFNIQKLAKPQTLPRLREMIQQVSPTEEMFPYFLSDKNRKTFGLFFLSEKNMFIEVFLKCLQFKCMELERETQRISPEFSCLKTLFSEVSRARKLKHMVSLFLIHFSFEPFVRNEKTCDLFLKSIVRHLLKNLQPYESLFQLSAEELAMVLPHTGEKEAVQQAQKLEWILNSMDYSKLFPEIKSINFQISVVEYPRSARDASSMLKQARQACAYGSKENKRICLSVPPTGFQPDFLSDSSPTPPPM